MSIYDEKAVRDISDKYEWDHVLMGCYGFVCGMAIHPKDPTVMYVWTDVGGMYRWDPENEKWIQLMDVLGFDYTDFRAVSGVALDPDDPNVVYAACGDNDKLENLTSDIIKSTDRGNTWTMTHFAEKIGSDIPVRCYNKTIARAVGDPLVIDPNNAQIMYFGTMEKGLYRSENQGETWTKIQSIPDTGVWPVKGGIANIYINPRKVKDGVSTDLYVSSWGNGIYKSTDGGLTFTLMEGSPIVPSQVQVVELDGKEKLYATCYRAGRWIKDLPPEKAAGTLYLYEDGVWTDLNPGRGTPEYEEYLAKVSFSSLLIDARDPNVILVNTSPWNEQYYYMWRSHDGGKTFERLVQTHQAARLLQDPLNMNNVWMPYGGDICYMENFATSYPAEVWDRDGYFIRRGLGVETLCVTKLSSVSGTQDAPLLLMLMQDHGLRVQEELQVQAPDRAVFPAFHHGGALDFCEGDPTFVVRGGTDGPHNAGKGTAAYSTDSGRSFTVMAWDESMRIVDGAVGAKKQANGFPIIMLQSVGRDSTKPDGAGIYRTLDGGETWTLMSTLPVIGTRYIASHCYNSRYIASDRVNPNVFYFLGSGKTLYRTVNGGDSWEEVTVSVAGVDAEIAGREAIKCVPGKAGHVWIKGTSGVIFTSTDFGETWSTLSGMKAMMSHACSFGFGMGKDPNGDVAVYVLGYLDGVLGCYLSDDLGHTWTKINPETQKFFAGAVDVVGDRRVYGRVFISTGGNGTLYAQLKT